MKLAKFEHSCLVLEEQGGKLVIDPGIFSGSFEVAPDTVALVITHLHPDHIDEAKVRAILEKNPEVQVFAPQQVKDSFSELPVTAVTAGESREVGPFKLEFFGGEHALVHSSKAADQNIGVFVNELLYYPGDSFAEPDKPVKVLALPAGAPWMKVAEAIDYFEKLKPELAFPTHDALLSVEGHQVHDMWFGKSAGRTGSTYRRLSTGESIEI